MAAALTASSMGHILTTRSIFDALHCNSVMLQNPRTVGNEKMVFEPLIVDGGDVNQTYRGDPFICAAATQA